MGIDALFFFFLFPLPRTPSSCSLHFCMCKLPRLKRDGHAKRAKLPPSLDRMSPLLWNLAPLESNAGVILIARMPSSMHKRPALRVGFHAPKLAMHGAVL